MVEAPGPVTSAWLGAGECSVDVAGIRHGATVSLKPLYDPDNARIRL
jgi:hypothetical protein